MQKPKPKMKVEQIKPPCTLLGNQVSKIKPE
jgi:hypothetical protein